MKNKIINDVKQEANKEIAQTITQIEALKEVKKTRGPSGRFLKKKEEKMVIEVKELKKPAKIKDNMSVLDPDPKSLNSWQKSLIGIGTLMIIIAPIVLFLAFLYQIKDAVVQHWQNALNIAVIIGAIIGIGNILFDIFSRLGVMRSVYTMIGKWGNQPVKDNETKIKGENQA